MRKPLRWSAAFLLLALMVAACISPLETGDNQPASANQVETIVAMTLRAMAPQVTDTPAAVAETSTSLLPRSLYFLGVGDQGSIQVIRMERDGRTKIQLTFEPVSVDQYDVSVVDGRVAYIVNNQLVLIDADGSNRRVLVDGGAREGNNPWVTSPVFSPAGGTLAYGHNGLNLYDLASGTARLVIEDQLSDPTPEGFRFPIELYSPERYSPDGTKLLVALGHWEALPSHAVYHPDTDALVPAEGAPDGPYCCSFHGGPVWAPDGASYYGIASLHDSAYQFGELWRVDAVTGAVTSSFASPFAGSETVYQPGEIFPAPDGQLFFFFGAYAVEAGFYDAPVLQLVRSAPDGLTARTVLRQENFALMNEALWAPDASFVIVATLPERRWDQGGGVLELYPTDAQKDAVWLASYGKQLKWGP